MTTAMDKLDALCQEVLRLGREHPHFIYRPIPGPGGNASCKYTEPGLNGDLDGELPGCIIGTALMNQGWPIELVRTYESRSAGHVVARLLGIYAVWEYFLNVVPGVSNQTSRPPEALPKLLWLCQVQKCQDKGHPWGEAITARHLTTFDADRGWHPEDDHV